MAIREMHPIWGSGFTALRRSIYANQILASIVEEWSKMDDMKRSVAQTRLAQLTETSSELRTKAIGHLIRLHFIPAAVDDEVTRLTPLLVQNIYEARIVDVVLEKEVQQLHDAGAISESWYHLAMLWSRQQRQWLKTARRALRDVVAEDDWTRGQQGAQRKI